MYIRLLKYICGLCFCLFQVFYVNEFRNVSVKQVLCCRL